MWSLAAFTGPPGAAAAIAAWLVGHWRLLLAGALAGGLWWQTERLEAVQASLDKRIAQEAIGRAEMRAHSAEAGQEALTTYVDQESIDRPLAGAVAARLSGIGVCAPGAVRPSESAAALDAARARAGDAEARARAAAAREAEAREFLEAAGRDLETCTGEMNRLRAWQTWWSGVDRRQRGGR